MTSFYIGFYAKNKNILSCSHHTMWQIKWISCSQNLLAFCQENNTNNNQATFFRWPKSIWFYWIIWFSDWCCAVLLFVSICKRRWKHMFFFVFMDIWTWKLRKYCICSCILKRESKQWKWVRWVKTEFNLVAGWSNEQKMHLERLWPALINHTNTTKSTLPY